MIDYGLTCANCNRGFTKPDLIGRNSDVIFANVDEIAEEAAADIQKELNIILRKAFK